MAMDPKAMMAAAMGGGAGGAPGGSPPPPQGGAGAPGEEEGPVDPSQQSPYDMLDQLAQMAGGDPKIQDLLQQLFQAFNEADQSGGPKDGNMSNSQ